MARETVRGAAVSMWGRNNRPLWDKEQTLMVCESVDKDLCSRGLTPAPQFRAARERRDTRYIQTWVMGCHFPWLNPRKRS